jgi:hypothetical protein
VAHRVQQDVGGLEVAVDDRRVGVVEEGEALGRAHGDLHPRHPWHGPVETCTFLAKKVYDSGQLPFRKVLSVEIPFADRIVVRSNYCFWLTTTLLNLNNVLTTNFSEVR